MDDKDMDNRTDSRTDKKMEGLTMEEAVELLLQRVDKIRETERVSLWDAVGRILAKDVYAGHDQPPFSRSPLDGYAVRSEDIANASREYPVRLMVLDEVDAGYVTEKEVRQGTAVRIMTGASIPEGADCVVRQENTDYGEESVAVYESVGPYENYCFAGEDYRAGARILEKDMQIGAVEAGVLASLGLREVLVYRRPRAAVITTGDEIVLPGEPLGEGKIYDSNLYTLVTRLTSLGIEVTCKKRTGDDAAQTGDAIREAAEKADILITTGGVSVGKKDIMHEVLKLLPGERIFWKISIKPGMPTLCAQYKGKLLICLSGNPYGAAVNLELLVRPLLAKMSGREELKLQRVRAVSESVFPKKSRVDRYVRAKYKDGRVRIPDGSNASGILSNMCGCNCLIELPAGTPGLKEGDEIWAVLL